VTIKMLDSGYVTISKEMRHGCLNDWGSHPSKIVEVFRGKYSVNFAGETKKNFKKDCSSYL